MAQLTTTEARETWESAAPGWARWEYMLASGFRDGTDTMLDMADVRPGMTVIDIACGAGSQSFQAAERVGSNGRVAASDISATMLSHVGEEAARLRVQNIETLECAAEDLAAASDALDAAICRLGLMLFPDPG
jgi:ubiquinone/menaquinone biosynthesis C-methylase UbiE